MLPRHTVTPTLARLVTGPDDAAPTRRYRPLVAGPVVLLRPRGAPVWTVELVADRPLEPRGMARDADFERQRAHLARRGIVARVAAALVGPLDAFQPSVPGTITPAAPAGARPRLDIYGWALMCQPPGMRGRALVDADDRFDDLPAVFELPLELLDRAEHLESRGWRTRPLVVPTRPEDFVPGPDGRLVNRYVPEATVRPPCRLERLW